MLAASGFATTALFLVAVLSRRVSVLVALPILVALVTGHGDDLGTLIAEGLLQVAPVAIMIITVRTPRAAAHSPRTS